MKKTYKCWWMQSQETFSLLLNGLHYLKMSPKNITRGKTSPSHPQMFKLIPYQSGSQMPAKQLSAWLFMHFRYWDKIALVTGLKKNRESKKIGYGLVSCIISLYVSHGQTYIISFLKFYMLWLQNKTVDNSTAREASIDSLYFLFYYSNCVTI